MIYIYFFKNQAAAIRTELQQSKGGITKVTCEQKALQK